MEEYDRFGHRLPAQMKKPTPNDIFSPDNGFGCESSRRKCEQPLDDGTLAFLRLHFPAFWCGASSEECPLSVSMISSGHSWWTREAGQKKELEARSSSALFIRPPLLNAPILNSLILNFLAMGASILHFSIVCRGSDIRWLECGSPPPPPCPP